MNINPNYLEITFDRAGVRNSQKRLKELIADLAVEPLKEYQDDLQHKFHLVEEILSKRIANVIAYWCENKHDPIKAVSSNMMSEITNSSKNDVTLAEFYISQVRDAMYSLSPILALEMPDDYTVDTDELEYALLELEEIMEQTADKAQTNAYDEYDDYDIDDEEAYYTAPDFDFGALPESSNNVDLEEMSNMGDIAVFAELVAETDNERQAQERQQAQQEKAIVVSKNKQVEKAPEQEININMVNISSEQAWQLTYSLIGFNSDYIQQQMLPRWQQFSGTFEKDRRFLYESFIDAIRNATGSQIIAGNYTFSDRPITIDQLWNHYFTDLSRNVGPLLSVARLQAAANDPWYKKWRERIFGEAKRISPVWLLALIIALIFDGLTTYVSLDQTPMEGVMVVVFTVLITILFQIADILVISYRQREFEADGLTAKYHAQVQRLTTTLDGLDTTSDSYVQLTMDKSRAHANWKAAQDNRKMARRGRFWSARIADINVVVTAYGFAFMFLNAEEPMYALFEQISIIQAGAWEQVNLWVFLMIGLATTVSFVINTAQRTEVLGWSMRRMRQEP